MPLWTSRFTTKAIDDHDATSILGFLKKWLAEKRAISSDWAREVLIVTLRKFSKDQRSSRKQNNYRAFLELLLYVDEIEKILEYHQGIGSIDAVDIHSIDWIRVHTE